MDVLTEYNEGRHWLWPLLVDAVAAVEFIRRFVSVIGSTSCW